MSTSRRRFLSTSAAAGSSLWLVTALAAVQESASTARQASGVKAGEITSHSAIIWTRLTQQAERVDSPHSIEGQAKKEEASLPAPVEQLAGACPGAAGKIRVRYGTAEDLTHAVTTDWAAVEKSGDYAHPFQLNNLEPATTYFYAVETTDLAGVAKHGVRRGVFTTAPVADVAAPVRLAFINCQKFHTREQPEGFEVYESIHKLKPSFVVFTGDNVYYDSDRPRAVTPDLARYHWQRCYSLPRHVKLLSSVGTYWLKDDHDSHSDDAFPQRQKPIMGDFTFAEGLEIYRQQVPIDQPYRTVRWGRDLQIWLMEGRDFRSANSAADGQDKTIWGTEQKAWLKKTMLESTATWKLLLSPTPLVGPDRANKGDNHANVAFAHEGNELRQWFSQHIGNRFFWVNGDRHWQYHSVDPATGVNEFSVGAASDGNAGGTPGYDSKVHRFHLVQGGFLTIDVGDGEKPGTSRIRFELRNVFGKVAYTYSAEQPAL